MVNQHKHYIAMLNRALDYIESNINKDLALTNIAKAAGFSPFHFHRIFKAMMNETLNSFIRRIRAEKVALMLFTNPTYTITKIAQKTGYSSSQALARDFKALFKITPQEYKKSKICYTNSKNGNAYQIKIGYTVNSRPTLNYTSITNSNMNVEIKELPDMPVAYIRHIGPYKGDEKVFGNLFERLCKWAGPAEVLKNDSTFICIYYDGPEVTDPQKLRVDAGIIVPKGTKTTGEVGYLEIPKGKYAIARFVIKDPKEYEQYWTELYANWLPESGYQPDDHAPFELYPSNAGNPENGRVVEICIPVKPA